tara:strand:+ start:302 stop:553 length:252 start_codon:yes stop_codon:yes gene_type:complete
MSIYVVIVEMKPDINFVVYHIEYEKELIQNHPEYMFFQDMLKSNMRMKGATFLRTMLEREWNIISQSQNNKSLYYTLSKHFKP